MRRLFVIVMSLFFIPVVQAQVTTQIVDRFGHNVMVPVHPQRVVTLSEIDLDAALTLGVVPVGTVNGRGQAMLPNYLLAQAGNNIQIVGDLGTPNLEAIITLAPDLILTGQARPELLALLREIAPTVVTSAPGDNWQVIAGNVATALNRQTQWLDFQQAYAMRLQQVKNNLAARQGNSISIVRWAPKGPIIMYQSSFASSVVESLGLVRPAAQLGNDAVHSQPLSFEALSLLEADWLVIGTLSKSGDGDEAIAQAMKMPAFSQLKVINEQRFARVDGSLWTSSGGPQAALRVIADVESLLSHHR